jgi:hypothetical protein
VTLRGAAGAARVSGGVWGSGAERPAVRRAAPRTRTDRARGSTAQSGDDYSTLLFLRLVTHTYRQPVLLPGCSTRSPVSGQLFPAHATRHMRWARRIPVTAVCCERRAARERPTQAAHAPHCSVLGGAPSRSARVEGAASWCTPAVEGCFGLARAEGTGVSSAARLRRRRERLAHVRDEALDGSAIVRAARTQLHVVLEAVRAHNLLALDKESHVAVVRLVLPRRLGRHVAQLHAEAVREQLVDDGLHARRVVVPPPCVSHGGRRRQSAASRRKRRLRRACAPQFM